MGPDPGLAVVAAPFLSVALIAAGARRPAALAAAIALTVGAIVYFVSKPRIV
jgi:hypothetical protein